MNELELDTEYALIDDQEMNELAQAIYEAVKVE